jgi:hypothetical protein
MTRHRAQSAYQQSLLQAAKLILVTMLVPSDHPLLVLKRKLDWVAIRDVIIKHLRAAGNNVDHGPGRPLDIDLYSLLIVLRLVLNLNARQMERELSENVVARIFVDQENTPDFQIRDHSNIDRIMNALGAAGIEELNKLFLNTAVECGFADPRSVSGDTTAQELPIGYPNEPGILRGIAQRCLRSLNRLSQKGKRLLQAGKEHCKNILRKAKEHHLFAKTPERKERILKSMMRQTRKLIEEVEKISQRLSGEKDRVVQSATKRLREMAEVSQKLLPQILYWMKTKTVAKGKIVHAGIQEARAIVRNKAGKKVEFGLQQLIGMLAGGYIFMKMIEKPTGESKMIKKLVGIYRENLGAEKTPEMLIYDRGGWSEENVEWLEKEGVEKIAIQPKGRAQWQVGGEDRQIAMSERGKTEGVIGTLKSDKYKLNKPKARKIKTIQAAGQRSVSSFNLQKLMRDLNRTKSTKLIA